ncbi:MAG: hypothetical protein ACRENP_03960 [Longimicrobiales bacterium]
MSDARGASTERQHTLLYRAQHGLRNVALALLVLAFTLDLGGRLTGRVWLWMAGGYCSSAGIALGLVAWALAWFQRRHGGQLLWLFGLMLFALARFLRGSAGVPPDSPLVVLNGMGCFLLAASLWRAKQKT